MLNTISDFHATSQVRDGAVASNTHAVGLGTRLKMLEKSDGQRGQGAVVHAVRSSPEECISPQENHRRGIFSTLCLSLCCIRSVSELRTSEALSPPPAELSAPYNNPVGWLSSSTASVCDDAPVLVAPTTVAGNSRRDEQLLSAYPNRMDEQIIVDHRRCVGYRKHGDESDTCIHINSKQYALQDYADFMQATEVDLIYMSALPFYRERLNPQWHSCQFYSIEVFDKKELAFIDKSKIADNEPFSYMGVDNAFPQLYHSAKLYHARRPDGSSMPSQLQVIELYGELVPVRTLNEGCYEVYCRDQPGKTLTVDWDGERWVSARYGAEVRIMHNLLTQDMVVREGDEIYRYQIMWAIARAITTAISRGR